MSNTATLPAASVVGGGVRIPQEPAAEGAATACFHCGDPCVGSDFARGEKLFCCQGCQIVHDLLTENGLGHFYDLQRHPGVRVDLSDGNAQWAFLDQPALQQQLLDFTDGKTSRVTFHIPAIHCVACVWLLENLFQLRPGIGRSQVHFPRRQVAISFDAEKIRLSEVVSLLASIGYEPALTLGATAKRPAVSGRRRQWLQIGIAGFGFGNIMLFSLPRYLGLDSLSGPLFERVFGYLSLALAAPVLIYSALDYWKSALLSVRQRVLTLDVPIALGLAALYGQSLFEIVFRGGEGYLDSLSGLVFLLLCGRVFQQKTHERLAFDRDYKSFFPLSITRIAGSREAGGGVGEERIALSELKVADRIVVRNGELIPADSRLVSGSACIDYSFVTGEAEPVPKEAGAYLYAGGKQIGTAIELETLKPVSQGYLTSLWNHETFQKERQDTLDTLTNRYSRRFTWLVVSVAVGAALFWGMSGDWARGLKAFTSVLIVACPCALALAAPFTLGTAQRWLGRIGVFLKNGHVLERMARLNAVVFDKTGTLTAAGAGALTFRSEPLNSAERAWIGSLARHSMHPHSIRISEALLSACAALPVRELLEIPGSGIQGQVQSHDIALGSRAWLASRGTAAGGGDSAAPEGTVHVAVDGVYRGAFMLSSSVRPETDRLLVELGRRYELALLSGDNERERCRFRSLFSGDARLHFNQSPLDKLGFIRNLQESGKRVMMVGDGLNDAGALKQSDVGVAVVEQTGVFSPASDVILQSSTVRRLSGILRFSRQSTAIVRVGFGISALYNLVGIGIASAGILSPLICAVLMPLSSVSVVLFACGATSWLGRRLAQETEDRARNEVRDSTSGAPLNKRNLLSPALSSFVPQEERETEIGFRPADLPRL